jgi:hypothetical protein
MDIELFEADDVGEIYFYIFYDRTVRHTNPVPAEGGYVL